MDSSDNIQGVEGIGKEGAKKLIDNIDITIDNSTPNDYFQLVQDKYIAKYGEAYLPIMLENFVLLRMLIEPKFDYPAKIDPIKYSRIQKVNTLINI